MSVPQVDLLKAGTPAGQKDVYKTLVAVFKEEPENPRVLADSEAFLAYTLKNGRTLRLIQRTNNMKGSMRSHTKPIHAIQFVNYRSNVAASAAEKEFLVWVVTNENAPDADPATSSLTVKLYFKLQDPVTVGSFAFFINAHVGIFDALILYGNKAAVLESSKIIPRYDSTPLEATLAGDARELRELSQPATPKSMCSINNSGWFAFTMEPTLVAACTLRNRSTPAWPCCEGAPIVNLELLDAQGPSDTTQLLACSSVKAFQWELTGDSEPRLLRTFWFGGSIVTMLSARSTVAIFNDKSQVALVELRNKDCPQATIYKMDTAVRAGSVCFNRKTEYASILVDAQAQVELYQLTVAQRDADGGAAAAQPAAKGISSPTTAGETGAAKKAAPALPIADPAILSISKEAAQQQQQQQQQQPGSEHLRNLLERVSREGGAGVTPPTLPTTTTAATPATASSSSAAATRAILHNSALPQALDGPLAAATHESDEAVRREMESVLNVSKNITQILQLTPDQIARDHELLVGLALEAQMTELQASGASVGGAAPAPAAAGAPRDLNGDAFNSFAIVKLMAPVANDIAKGVALGIRNTLRTELDHAVRDALGSTVREAQQKALARRLDEALQESSTQFSALVRQRLADFAARELKDVFTQVNTSINTLVEENRRLQASINEMARSGVLEQLKSTRQELQQLKEALQSGQFGAGAGAGIGSNPSTLQAARSANPETILSTARALLLNEHKAREALQYVTMAQQPQLTLQLLRQATGEVYQQLLTEESISDALWLETLAQVSNPAALAGSSALADDVVFIAQLLLDVVCERDAITELTSASAQSLKSNIRHFVARRRQAAPEAEAQGLFRDLEKSIQ